MGAFDRLGHRMEGRRRAVLYTLGGLLLLAAAFGLYSMWSNRRAEEGSLALGKAIEIATAGIAQGPTAAAAKGLTFPTERERAQRAVEEFQKVAANHGSPYRELAQFFAAVNQLKVERSKGLEELAALTKSDNDEVAARAKFALAQAKEDAAPGEDKERQNEEAIALYNELLKDKNAVVPHDILKFRIASIHERLGRKDEAAEILFRLVEEARNAKDAKGKPVFPSETVTHAESKLRTLSPERHAQLPPEQRPGLGM